MRDAIRERRFFIALSWVLVPAVAALSFLPEGDKRELHSTGRFHSVGHFLVFSFVTFVVGKATRSVWMRLLLFVGLLILGFGIEAAEHVKYQSALEWTDVLVDSLGVIGGMLLAVASERQNG